MNQPLIWVSGGAFMIGLALAGSEGAWFPWINFAGVVIIGAAVWALEKAVK